MVVLAIDPGIARSGYAITDGQNLLDWGTIYTEGKDYEKRKIEILEKIYVLSDKYGVTECIVEAYRVYRSPLKAQHKTIELIGAIKEGLRLKGISVREVNKNTWGAKLRRIYVSGLFVRLGKEWIEALNSAGSEHSRDAVGMLVAEAIDLRNIFIK